MSVQEIERAIGQLSPSEVQSILRYITELLQSKNSAVDAVPFESEDEMVDFLDVAGRSIYAN